MKSGLQPVSIRFTGVYKASQQSDQQWMTYLGQLRNQTSHQDWFHGDVIERARKERDGEFLSILNAAGLNATAIYSFLSPGKQTYIYTDDDNGQHATPLLAIQAEIDANAKIYEAMDETHPSDRAAKKSLWDQDIEPLCRKRLDILIAGASGKMNGTITLTETERRVDLNG